MERALNLAQARYAIEDVLYRYAEAIDDGDMAALSVVLGGCTVILPDGSRLQGGTAIADHYRSIIRFYDADGNEVEYQRGHCTPRTRHVTTNVRCTFDAPLTGAEVRSYFTAYQTFDGRNEIVAGGRYHDRFQMSLRGWAMVERRVLIDNAGDMSRHLRTTLA
jgi:3-phenylpropionate/cinnamic acid dioxygenase small subunit